MPITVDKLILLRNTFQGLINNPGFTGMNKAIGELNSIRSEVDDQDVQDASEQILKLFDSISLDDITSGRHDEIRDKMSEAQRIYLRLELMLKGHIMG